MPLPIAHLVQTGFGALYDGLVHWAITPEDVMLILGLSLLAALSGKEKARILVFVLPAVWFLGGLIGLFASGFSPPMLATTLSFGLIGILVAIDKKLPTAAFLMIALVVACLHGISNGSAMATAGLGWLGLVGVTLAVFIMVSLLPAIFVGFKKPAARIALRVGGSWIAAAAILMVGALARST